MKHFRLPMNIQFFAEPGAGGGEPGQGGQQTTANDEALKKAFGL